MLNVLLIISLVVFFIGGYRLMARLDRFLDSGKVIEDSRKDKRLSFDQCRVAWRHVKRHLPNSAEACMPSMCESAVSGEVNR